MLRRFLACSFNLYSTEIREDACVTAIQQSTVFSIRTVNRFNDIARSKPVLNNTHHPITPDSNGRIGLSTHSPPSRRLHRVWQSS